VEQLPFLGQLFREFMDFSYASMIGIAANHRALIRADHRALIRADHRAHVGSDDLKSSIALDN